MPHNNSVHGEPGLLSRRSLLKGGAGLAAIMSVGAAAACGKSTSTGEGKSGAAGAGYGRAQGIITNTALESFNLGAMHAWKQLGCKFDQQDMSGGPQQQLNQAQSYKNLGVTMSGSVFLEDSLYDSLALLLGRQGVFLHNYSNAIPWRSSLEEKFGGKFVGTLQGSFADEGYRSCKALCEAAGGEGELIHLLGAKGSASDAQRSTGVNLALREFPNVRVVATQAASWDRVIGQRLTETLVPAHPNVTMIMAQSDSIGIGVIAALKSLKKNNVFVAGADGEPLFLQSMAAGDYAVATVAVRYDRVGVIAATRAFDWYRGKADAYDPLESALRVDGVFIDTAEAAKAVLDIVPVTAKPGEFPYDAPTYSRVLQPNDWKVPVLTTVMDPYFEWGPGGANPTSQPSGFAWPKAYATALTPSKAAELNKRFSERIDDPFASVRTKAKSQEPVLGTLVRLGLVKGAQPYTAPAGYV